MLNDELIRNREYLIYQQDEQSKRANQNTPMAIPQM
jgi:hypothetical protein